MRCQFRYGSGESHTVVLRLFRDVGGTPRGDVCGPVIIRYSGKPARSVDRCILDLETALCAAIRIANTTDTEVVVAGDASLWDARWGQPVFEAAEPCATAAQ